MPTADSAGVRFPPPLFYVAGLAAGLVATRFFPTPWAPPAQFAPWLAAVLLVMGAAFASPALIQFVKARTSVLPHRPSTSLVISGPYRFTRNPMYVAMGLVYAGVAILYQSLWAILLLPLVLAAVQREVIYREEAYLERRFGSEYTEYCRRVRRWL